MKKGSSSPRAAGRPCVNRAILCANLSFTSTGPSAPSLPTRRRRYTIARDDRNLMSDRKYRQRGYQDDDRDRPAAPKAAASRARTGCARGSPPYLAGRPEEHQHAGLPRGRSLRAVRHRGVGATSGSTAAARAAVPTSTRARSARHSIPGSRFECMQPIPARITPKNASNSLHVLLAAHDRRARNHDAAHRRRAKGVRRPVQVLERPSSWNWSRESSVRTGPTRPSAEHLAVIEAAGHAALLHADDWRARDGADRAARCSTSSPASTISFALEEVNFILEQDRAAQYGVEQHPGDRAPAGEQDTRMRFLGAPAGYEFMSLIEAVILAGTNDSRTDAGQSRAHRRARDRTPRHPGLRHADVPALPASRDARASDGARKSAHSRDLRRSDGVHGSLTEVPRDRRSQDDRQRIDRDPGSAARGSVRARRARIAGNGFADRASSSVRPRRRGSRLRSSAVFTKSSFGYSASR